MDKKITRRAVLGTGVAALIAGPFVIKALRRNRVVDLPSNFAESFSFPRIFDTEWGNTDSTPEGWPSPPPREVRDKIFATQERLWQNYSKLDELQFVLVSSRFRDGKLIPSSHEFYHAEVWFKLGYGVEIRGKNTLGREVHLVLNIDGEDNQPFDEHRVNLSDYAHSLFSEAFPMYAKMYEDFEENVLLPNSWQRKYSYSPPNPMYPPGLPDSFETQPQGRYTKLVARAENVRGPNNVFCNRYFSQNTGMPELTIVESVIEGHECCSPLYAAYIYQNVRDIFFPSSYNLGKIDKWAEGRAVYAEKKEYSDVRVKFIS